MKIFSQTLTSLILLALSVVAFGQSLSTSPLPSPAKRVTADTIDRDKIAIYDVGDLPFEKILKAQDAIWILAQITLQPQKTFSFDKVTHPGTQGVVTLPWTDGTPRAQGTLEVKSFLTGKGVSTENYDFVLPEFFSGPNTVVDHVTYSPFCVGGYAICQVNPTVEGKDRYSPVYIVPAEWQALVAPAFDFCRANPTLFSDTDTALSAARRTQLTALLTSPNPYLASFACRTLTRAGALDAGTVDRALRQADPFRQAMMTYLLLKNAPRGDTPTGAMVDSGIARLAGSASILENLNGVTLGVDLADDAVGTEATRTALKSLSQVKEDLAPDPSSKSYVSTLLSGASGLIER